MRRLTLLLVSLVLLSIQSVLAQSFRVKGTVVSAEDNEPMIGVTIKQEGTSNGVVTDIDGNYTIEIKGASKATLAFSYVGCLTQKHVVKEQTNTLNITLAPDSKMMDEVVVVAYGVRKKGTIAGSVSAVKAEKIENVPAASFDQALQGQSTVCRSSPLRVSQARLPLSRFVVPTPSILARLLSLFWTVCLSPAPISIP